MSIKRKIYNILLVIVASLSILNFFSETSYAIKGGGLSVTPVYPDNQDGGELGYFNLKVTPDEEQEIKVKLTNNSDQEMTVGIVSNQSTTSDGGVIVYDKENKNNSVKYKFNDIVSIKEKKIVIPANESVEVDASIKIPAEEFEGQIIGGLTFFEDRELSKDEKEQTVVNNITYSIPVVLFEEKSKIEPKMSLKDIKASSRNNRPFIEASIENSASVLINDLVIDGKIISKSNNQTFITRTEETYKMAPNSDLNFGFDLKSMIVEPGEYSGEFVVTANGKKFNLKKDFTITKKEADKVNDENLFKLEEKTPIWIYIALGLVLVLLIILAVVYYRKHKRKKSKKKKRKKNNKRNRA